MAVKIRLLRMGKIRNPQYRIVVADSRTKRDGRAIEYIGIYQPKEHPSLIEVKSDRVQYWLGVGAQPSEPVQRILEKTGDWQKFKGLPAPAPLLVAPSKQSKTEVYEAEAKAAAGLADTKPAATPKKAKGEAKPAAAPEAAEAKPEQTKVADPAEPNREAVAETAEDPAGAGADAS
ncbi:30S ribosomal protein S16 [Actinoplanes sp. SE50]|uniref:30S ribosomal protein S16 n=1 Tax=unclassified Actinoplanes TaxID=2626549 RepID=UPI00023EDE3D|nr:MULTISPECIES: 30S ribosomal protein S16 [unclassified Actinoplanes]AEV88161.1 30S ribosomal protein S16 [Actinoplanes sp. SE50/110]ATO86566.1 30S ribosomal protein S16 [Actinoplanes sp. SE50]SLM03983.1 30S ribosomal protein S16 [Actinoplanes sp. SE50/110]